MKFWDSSAVVPLLVTEAASESINELFRDDPDIVVWWATAVECASALARLEREGALKAPGMTRAFDRLTELELGWNEIQPTDRLRVQATRLLRVHPLGSADSLQLAAATVAAEMEPRTLPLVTLDERLALAAEREGFPVVGPAFG
jgi:predicted nucleic acid-binding protein